MAGLLQGLEGQLNLISGEEAIWKGGAQPLSNMAAPCGKLEPARIGVWTAFQGRYRL